MTTNNKTHHIVQLTAENVKRLKAVTIKPDGNLVVIGGRNGQGKSSILDSIAMAIGGADEQAIKPIRDGQERAEIVLDLGDLVIKRTFTAGGSSLVVENGEGARYKSPQTMLDALTGKLTFDPLAFARLEPKAQKAALEKLLGLDFSDLEKQRTVLYAERTGVNRQVDALRAVVGAMPKFDGVPTEEQASGELVSQLEAAQKQELVIKDLQRGADDANRAALAAEAELKRIGREIDELAKKLEAAETALGLAATEHSNRLATKARADEALAETKSVDVSPVKAKLAELDATNAKVRANLARAKKIEEGKTAKAKSDKLTADIAAIDAEREKRLAATAFPIEGLTITEDGIAYSGIPFSQASAAEQMRVSVAIAAAANPKLRVMLVRDGSLMDQDSMRLLSDLASKHNLQVWVERVGKDENVSVLIEDGQIQASK